MSHSYAKIWTDIESDDWFLSLSLTARGLWLQLIISAKKDGDTGTVWGRSWAALGSRWGCDGKTCRKILGNFRDSKRCTILHSEHGAIGITVVKYNYWQSITAKELHAENSSNRGISTEFSSESPSKQSIPEHTRAEQTIAPTPIDDANAIFQEYQLLCPLLVPASKLTRERRDALAVLRREYPELDMAEYFRRCNASLFLCGDNNNGWKAGFDWVVKPENVQKVLEGQYDNREKAKFDPVADQKKQDTSFLDSYHKGRSRDTYQKSDFTRVDYKPKRKETDGMTTKAEARDE